MMIDLQEAPAIDLDAGIANWEHCPASTVSHHGQACCDIAREWIIGMDFSQLNTGNPLVGPRWLRKKFEWGPSKWPIHWCEVVEQETLDCGALAALSYELFRARGLRSFPAQFILEFNDVSTRHWSEAWNAAGSCLSWISEGLIYHEGCAITVRDNEIKLWDATATWWINPKQFGGYAGLLAVRVFDVAAVTASTLIWGRHCIPANIWHKVDRARSDFATPAPARKQTSKRGGRAARTAGEPAAIT